ncbi:MAG: multiheme c-type cytochrome [Rubrivivax sp.]
MPATAAANCDSCHRSGFSTWAPAKLHSSVTLGANCSTCHTGAYPPAVGKPSNTIHAGVSGNCESCHKSTSSWSSAKVDHSGFNASTNCASCHNGSAASGKSANHIPVGATNCFSCHGTTGWTPTKWNHSQLTVAAQCASCHTGGYPPADGRSASHIPYTAVAVTAGANCDTCHRSGYGAWSPAKLHGSVTVSSGCSTCHTGAYPPAVGKPSNALHATVTGNCESCHKSTSSWGGAKVDHSAFNAATNCASCHNGSAASGKSATHVPVGATNCFSCHGTTGWTPTKWNHTQLSVTAQCATCHTGGYPPADGRSANHVPYTAVPVTAGANCDTCHRSGFSTWAPAKLHSNVTLSANCSTCHTGAYPPAVGKPSNTIHATVTGNCESCHKSTSSWSGAKVDHSGFNAATNCASCHNGSGATGKSATHVPVGATNCFSCHGTTGWTPTKWNHTQLTVTAQCATCHTGGYPPADGRSANHVPYAAVPATAGANCDTCHRGGYSAWVPAKVHANTTLNANCSTCHTGAYPPAVGKPSNTIHATVTGNCESCHKSTSSWGGAKVDHSGFNAATNCASCHNGSGATGKSATHVPVGATNCFSCHGTTGWTPTKWNHTQLTVTAQCATCHTGGYPPADGRPANHIPYAGVPAAAGANCDTCHRGSFSTWANGRLHASLTISTGCFTCHTGSYLAAVGKPGNAVHATVTGNCESCHKSTSSWGTVSFAHSAANAVGTGTCDTCHNGSTATGKPASHIPVPAGTARCDSCHRSQSGWKSSVTMNHSVVSTATCKSCHNGSYLNAGSQGAKAKPLNHIPEVQLLNGASMDCNACHVGTSSWGSPRMNHNNSQGSGAGWCKACHQSGTSYAGSLERKSLTHEKSTGVVDCSQSGCHRPLGTKGSTFSKWD